MKNIFSVLMKVLGLVLAVLGAVLAVLSFGGEQVEATLLIAAAILVVGGAFTMAAADISAKLGNLQGKSLAEEDEDDDIPYEQHEPRPAAYTVPQEEPAERAVVVEPYRRLEAQQPVEPMREMPLYPNLGRPMTPPPAAPKEPEPVQDVNTIASLNERLQRLKMQNAPRVAEPAPAPAPVQEEPAPVVEEAPQEEPATLRQPEAEPVKEAAAPSMAMNGIWQTEKASDYLYLFVEAGEDGVSAIYRGFSKKPLPFGDFVRNATKNNSLRCEVESCEGSVVVLRNVASGKELRFAFEEANPDRLAQLVPGQDSVEYVRYIPAE